MKIKIFLVLYTLFYLNTHSQNLVKNPGFETIVGNEVSNDQFKNNNVEHWKGFMGTPDIVRKGSNDKKIARIGGSPDNREGIFQMRDGKFVNNIYTRDKIFKKGKIYLVSFRFMFSNGTFGVINPTIKVIAGNSFVEDRNLPNSVALNNLNDLNNEVIGLPSFLKNQFNSDIKKPNYIN